MATQSQTALTAITPTTQSQIELQHSTQWTSEAEPDHEHESLLPPTDTGKAAWLFLASAFVIEMMVWGT
jgi:hypothetical protein